MWGQLTINRDAQTAARKWSRQTCFAGRGEQDMGSVWPLRSVVALIGVSFCAFTASAKDKIVFGTDAVAVGEHHGIHCPGAGARNRIEPQASILEEPIEHPPGERAMRPAALEREGDRLEMR